MAKITLAGDAVVVTSSVKLEDLRTVKKYRPEALVLKGGEDGKEPIFKVGVTCGAGSIDKYGASFGAESRDEEKLATITMVLNGEPDGDIRDYVADSIGAAILSLNEVEAGIPAVLAEIAEKKAQILSNITIAQ